MPAKPKPTEDPPEGKVWVPCLDDGRNPDCQHCQGRGWELKPMCPRCMGGKVPGRCPDCRGNGWKEDLRVI